MKGLGPSLMPARCARVGPWLSLFGIAAGLAGCGAATLDELLANAPATAARADGALVGGSSKPELPENRAPDLPGSEIGEWSFGGLGTLPGGVLFAAPQALAEDGRTVVGAGRLIEDGTARAVWWGLGASNSVLAPLSGTPAFAMAYGVSSSGDVVVGQSRSTRGWEAVRWVGATATALGDLPGGGFASSATALSAGGSVVAGWSESSAGIEAFIWTAARGMVGLGDLPGGDFVSRATAISADGSTVVGVATSASGERAFRWTAAEGMVDLGTLPGGLFSRATAVSPDARFVVGVSESERGEQATLWTFEGGILPLGDLPDGDFFSIALGVSADGTTVVGLGSDATGQTAFIWREGFGIQSMSSFLTGAGLNLGRWKLSEATAVSPDATAIVGRGEHDGILEGWLAYIPP